MSEKNKATGGFFARLKQGLSKTHQAVTRKIEEATMGQREISEDVLDNLEEALITSDLGVATVDQLMAKIRWQVKRNELDDAHKIKQTLRDAIRDILLKTEQPLEIQPVQKPFTILTIGVNGTGKTTTIAKLAEIFKQQGHSVMLAAADTFRAAAIEQLEIWGKRTGCEVIKHAPGADPSAVAFDALQSAKAQSVDILIIDTAGRLHTKAPLMEELKKIERIITREHQGAPHETLLVLDATTGQNAISQAKIFSEALKVTGIALTKLDGTAKGGVIVGISDALHIPIRYIGVGEQVEDLRPFNADDFVDALFDD
jgi:fused signal recognition particle receptor